MKSNRALNYIVIHKCHCIDIWGYDIRAAYPNLGALSSLKMPDYCFNSNIPNATAVWQTCNRSNITIHVKPKRNDGKDQVVEVIHGAVARRLKQGGVRIKFAYKRCYQWLAIGAKARS